MNTNPKEPIAAHIDVQANRAQLFPILIAILIFVLAMRFLVIKDYKVLYVGLEVIITTLLIIVSSYFIYYYLYKLFRKSIKFDCPNCFKVIYPDDIGVIKCPHCYLKKYTFLQLIRGGCRCKKPLIYYSCPHCHNPINLDFYEEQSARSFINVKTKKRK